MVSCGLGRASAGFPGFSGVPLIDTLTPSNKQSCYTAVACTSFPFETSNVG